MSIEIIKATISSDCETENLEVVAVAAFSLRDAVEVKVAKLNAEAKEAKALHRYYTNVTSVRVLFDRADVGSL